MKRSKHDVGNLFTNNKFNVAFSVVAAIIIWLSVVIVYSPEDQETISGVPINISSSIPDSYGLKALTQTKATVDITVSGKRYILSELKKQSMSDVFKVTAITDGVVESGEYNLKVKVEKVNEYGNFEIEGYSPQEITVFYDKTDVKKNVPTNIRFSLSDNTIVSMSDSDFAEKILEEGYTCYPEEIKALSTQTLNVSGAQTELKKVSTVEIEIDLDEKLNATTTFENDAISNLIPITEAGGTLSYLDDLTQGENAQAVKVIVPVYKLQSLPLKLSFTNGQDGLDAGSKIKYSIMVNGNTLSTLNAAVNESVYTASKDELVMNIDLSKLNTTADLLTVMLDEENVKSYFGDGVKITDENAAVILDLGDYNTAASQAQ